MTATVRQVDVVGLQEWDEFNDNIDVVIELMDGRRFAATFFTVINIQSLMSRWQQTGECLHGAYFWSAHAVVVRDLRRDTLLQVAENLAQEKELESACLRLTE